MAFHRRLMYSTVLLIVYVVYFIHGNVEIETGIGTIIGSRVSTTVNDIDYMLKLFRGIPYAKPPTGERRFTKPEVMPVFESPFEALSFGNACPQPSFPGIPEYARISEDCLYLNVYVPDQKPDGTDGGHAVMIWIHGGGFIMGAAETYPCEHLSGYGNVIVVTINYRLGVFGFMDTEDGKIPGNLAFHDQHMAIQWVHKNIEAFGGDKNRVTIFGESAGGSSVIFQGLYPENEGLIHRVIAESGVPTAVAAVKPNPRGSCLLLAKELGCKDTGIDDIIACLKSIDTEVIMSTLQELYKDPQKMMELHFVPTVDGEIIKIAPHKLARQSKIDSLKQVSFFRSLDFISGFTNQDGGVFLLVPLIYPIADLENFTLPRDDFITKAVPSVLQMTAGHVPDVVKSLIVAEYTNWTHPDLEENNRDQYVRLLGDAYFTMGSIEMSRMHSNVSGASQNSYAFRFSAAPTTHALITPSWLRGANHGDDVLYVLLIPKGFGELVTGRDEETKPTADWEYELSYRIATYWTNFAKSGNPNEPVGISPEWPRYESTVQQYIDFDRDMSDQSVGKFLHAREATLWLDIIPEVMAALSHDHDPSSPFVKRDDDGCSVDGTCDGD